MDQTAMPSDHDRFSIIQVNEMNDINYGNIVTISEPKMGKSQKKIENK